MKTINLFFVLLFLCLLLSSCKEYSVEHEPQFVQIYFKYGFKNELNTFDNTFQKDLIMGGVKKVEFWLTDEEQIRILEKVNSINYFSLPDTLRYIWENGIIERIDPDPGEQILRIKYQQDDKRTIWTYPINFDDPEFKDLIELTDFIISIIESKPEYKKLPPAKGGYQ